MTYKDNTPTFNVNRKIVTFTDFSKITESKNDESKIYNCKKNTDDFKKFILKHKNKGMVIFQYFYGLRSCSPDSKFYSKKHNFSKKDIEYYSSCDINIVLSDKKIEIDPKYFKNI
jgi:hypothetical protein